MAIVEIFTTFELLIYLLSTMFFLLILGVMVNVPKNKRIKPIYIFLVITQIIAYAIWTFDYISSLPPIGILIGVILDSFNPILIFLILFKSIEVRRKK